MRIPRKDSLWKALTPEQRDQVMLGRIHGSLGVKEAAALCTGWLGKRVTDQRLSKMVENQKAAWKLTQARAAAQALEEIAPESLDEATKRALGQRRFTAALEDLDVSELVALDRNELLREKIALDRQRVENDVRVTRRNLALDRARILLERARGGERSEDLQKQIDFAIEEIERMKKGEDA